MSEPISLERLVPPRRLGKLLAGLREARGDTLEGVAVKSWGQLTVERVQALERGEIFVEPDELTLLADLYAFDLTDLVPQRMELVIDFEERVIAASGFAAVVPRGETIQQVLRRYLTLVWALRGKQPGSHLQMRELDLDILGEGLGVGKQSALSLISEIMDDATWQAQRGHPSMLATILPVKVTPQTGILLTAGAEAALVFQPPEGPETPED